MANPITLTDLGKALDELIMQDAPPMLADDDITVMRLVSRAKVGVVRAKTMLKQWQDAGKVEYVGKRREERGHMVDAWRLKA